MANLSRKIEKHLGRQIDFQIDVVLQNDGGETYIKEWNVAEDQPELEDLKKIDVIITFGNLMKNTFKKITHNKSEIFHFTDFKKLNDKFHSIIKKNDLIYIKGSRSMYLERLYL